MNDKLQRVKTLLMNDRESIVKDEPLEDAYLDVSNYGITGSINPHRSWKMGELMHMWEGIANICWDWFDSNFR